MGGDTDSSPYTMCVWEAVCRVVRGRGCEEVREGGKALVEGLEEGRDSSRRVKKCGGGVETMKDSSSSMGATGWEGVAEEVSLGGEIRGGRVSTGGEEAIAEGTIKDKEGGEARWEERVAKVKGLKFTSVDVSG